MIHFNRPLVLGSEIANIKEAIDSNSLCGDGPFSKKCDSLLKAITGTKKALITTSCTHALEMASILSDIKPGDEVIMPSFTFVSTANPFVLRGAKIIFIDIRPDTMNIDENKIEEAITSRTRVIVPVHYAGVACEMDKIMNIANKYGLFVIEDAAQGINSYYKGNSLGSIGDIGVLSFHETKNIHCGEGGAILINNANCIERSEIVREKGTDRSRFLRGQVDKYSWVDVGSSYLPSELNAAFLLTQLENRETVINYRLNIWNLYYNGLRDLESKGVISLPFIPEYCKHNGHIFYIKVQDINVRQKLITYLKNLGIQSAFHYIPLHSSVEGIKVGNFFGRDQFTSLESEKLLRLPMHFMLSSTDINYIISSIYSFYNEK